MKTFIRHFLIVFILVLGFENANANSIAVPANGSDATLKSLVLSTATNLVFANGAADYNYTTSVSPGTATLTVTPTTSDPAATVTVNGIHVNSGTASGAITLNGIVTTTINLMVTASDGVTTSTYAIVVSETGSNDAFLSGLSISTGNALVTSATGGGNYNYTTSVSPGTTSLSVTPTTVDSTAKISVNVGGGASTPVTSGTASVPLALNAVGTTTINVVVLAQDNITTLTYQIVVSKTGSNIATLSSLTLSTNTPLIATTGPSNFNYTAAVNAATASLTITPTATDPTATITVNVGGGASSPVTSGTASGLLTLNAAPATTTINVVVTAQDGTTTQSYSIVVSRTGSNVATLSHIAISGNSALIYTKTQNGNIYYTTSVPVGPITVTPTATDANATITVNGTVVASGAASGPIAINANPATTLITLVVTSQDGSTTQSTFITVSQNGSNNAYLSALSLSTNSQLVASAGAYDDNYTTSVTNPTASLTVSATGVDANSTITVNGVAVANGGTSGAITLNANPATTLIVIVVTAQDGTTIRKTGITISQTGSNNANLSAMVLSPFSSLVFVKSGTAAGVAYENYSTSVSPTCTQVNITPTFSDPNATTTIPNATIFISGPTIATTQVMNKTASIWVPLNAAGTTTFTLTVTSTGGTQKNYNITVSKNGSNNARITSITLSTGTPTPGGVGPYTLNYTSTVSPHTTSVSVTTVLSDVNAILTVNGLGVASGVASNPVVLNAAGTTLIRMVVTAQDGVTKQTVGITISKTGSIIAWGGSTSVTWATGSNWVGGKAPGAGDVATFGVSAYTGANQPTISSATTVGEIDFGPNATPVITVNSKLTVGTNLTDSSSTVTIKGTSAVDVATLATINFTGTNGKITITSPVVVTLKSNAAGSASVGQLANGNSIAGTVSVERYITGGSSIYRGYRLLTSSVYTATSGGNNIYSLNYVKTSALVSGTTGAAGGFDHTGNPSLFLYRENLVPSATTFTGSNYRGINDINVRTPQTYLMDIDGGPFTIPAGNGFMFFFRGDRTTNIGSKYTAGTVAESVTMTETGTLNQGAVTVKDWFTPAMPNLSYTAASPAAVQGYNLVGNPYASSIDWDTYSATNAGAGIYAPQTTGTIYVLDPVSKNFGVYTANSPFGGTNNATHIIPSGQGFFVVALDPNLSSLTFNESAKTTTQVYGANLLMGKPVENTVSQYLHLKLNQDTSQVDEIYISFNKTAKSNYVMSEDVPQRPGYGIAGLSSMSGDGVPLSINTLNLPQQSETIALNVTANLDGAYLLTIPEIKSVPEMFDIWLMDNYKKDSINVKVNPAYSFNIVKSDSASFGSKRFSLVIRQNPAFALQLLNFTATKASSGAQVVWKTINEANYTHFTVERSTDGGVTYNVLGGFSSSELGTYSFTDKDPLITTNRYRLKLEDVNGAISYSKVVTLLYGNLSNDIAGHISIYPNPSNGIINLSITPFRSSAELQAYSIHSLAAPQNSTTAVVYDIKIINTSGYVIKSATSSSPNWQSNVSGLAPGTYIVQVINNSDKSVVGKSTFIKY